MIQENERSLAEKGKDNPNVIYHCIISKSKKGKVLDPYWSKNLL